MASLDLRDPKRPPWSGWDVALIAFVFIFSDVVAIGITAAYLIRVHHARFDQLASDARMFVPSQIVAYALTFLVMYVVVTRSHHCPFWQCTRWVWPESSGGGVGYFLLGVPLAVGVGALQRVLPMPSHTPFDRLFTSPDAVYLIAGMAVVAAPFMEELFFRGFLFPVLRRYGTLFAILSTSLAFAVMHGGQYGWAWGAVLLMFIVGLVLTVARAWTGSVAPGFLIHAGYNLTLFVLMYFATDHFRHLDRMTQ